MNLITKFDIVNPNRLTGKKVKFIVRVRKVSPNDCYRYDGSYSGIDRRESMLSQMCQKHGYELQSRWYNRGLTDQYEEQFYIVDKKWLEIDKEIQKKECEMYRLRSGINNLESNIYHWFT